MSNIPPISQPTKQCPHCGKAILVSATWCPHCGAGFASQSGAKYQFGFIWFLALFLIVPLVACGGCFLGLSTGFSGSSSSDAGGILMTVSFIVMCASVLAGFVLLVVNLAKGKR